MIGPLLVVSKPFSLPDPADWVEAWRALGIQTDSITAGATPFSNGARFVNADNTLGGFALPNVRG